MRGHTVPTPLSLVWFLWWQLSTTNIELCLNPNICIIQYNNNQEFFCYLKLVSIVQDLILCLILYWIINYDTMFHNTAWYYNTIYLKYSCLSYSSMWDSTYPKIYCQTYWFVCCMILYCIIQYKRNSRFQRKYHTGQYLTTYSRWHDAAEYHISQWFRQSERQTLKSAGPYI